MMAHFHLVPRPWTALLGLSLLTASACVNLIKGRVTTNKGVVSTLAGQAGKIGYADGTGSVARFNGPIGVAVDANGTVYVADSGNHTIRKMTAAGTVSTLTCFVCRQGSTDGPRAVARFYNPSGVAVDAAGTVYVADYNNHTIRKITAAGVVSTLAGTAGDRSGDRSIIDTGGNYGSTDGTGAAARFSHPSGVAVDAAGVVYVADSGNHTIRKITATGVVSTLAGLAGSKGSADGPGMNARFNFPEDVAVDASGTVYVADSGNRTIRKITRAGMVSTLAGLAGSKGSADGQGAAARFNLPYGVAVDASGTVYVADQFDRTIRKITRVGVVSTLAGTAGHTGAADGTGAAAQFSNPSGVAVDAAGTVYVADQSNHTIRVIR
jgi:sugar lactone lactonase YvrE